MQLLVPALVSFDDQDLPILWRYRCTVSCKKSYLTTDTDRVDQITAWCFQTFGSDQFKRSWRWMYANFSTTLWIEFTDHVNAVTFDLVWSNA
jgi:hypothetical protein